MSPDHELEISRCIFREANDAFFIMRPDDLRILDVNPAAQRLTEFRRKELLAMSLGDLVESRDADAIAELTAACQSTSCFMSADGFVIKGRNSVRAIQLSASRIHTWPETLALLVVHDVSKQKALEEELHHARRMEAIGGLASGVAHEFNNLLTIINGYSALMLEQGGDPADPLLEEISNAGERAASFTRQLLEFGSKQWSGKRVIDLGRVVAGMEKMLGPLLGDCIEIVAQYGREPLPIEADRSRIEQLIMNLAINARDAMPGGGRLMLEALDVVLTADDVAERPDLAPGPHVVLRASDTGCGMDETTMARIFEPFFSTKPRGAGTGLGLAVVYSAVKQSRGHITVESQPRTGTTFTIHFPKTHKVQIPRRRVRDRATPSQGGVETILLVEDDDAVRRLVQNLLEQAGYSVIAATDGPDALARSARLHEPIQLLLTDYLMPGMCGDELGTRLTRERPGLRVLCMTGGMDFADNDDIPTQAVPVLKKPFSPSQLIRQVRDILDR